MIAKQFVYFFLALLILVSTAGISIKQHYCCGKYIYSSFSFLDWNCMDGEMPPDSPCCSDNYQFFQVDSDFQASSSASMLDTQLFQLAKEIPMNLSLYVQEASASPKLYYYRPPLIERDIQVLVQSFLI